MRISKNTNLNIFLTGMIGFLAASFAGIFSTYLVFKLNLFRPLLNLIPEEQPLIRLYAGIGLAFLGVAIGGAINGLLRGYTLHTVDSQGSQRRYLLGSAFAYGISGGILLIPVLLLLALLSQYNPGSSKDPLTFLTVFTLIGAFYGLFSGLLLALLTLRLRYIWLPWLASIVGTALGGLLLGAIVWRQGTFLALPSRLLQAIVFLLFLGVALVGLAGGLIALAYRWAAKRREGAPDKRIEPGRVQDGLLLVLGVALVVLMTAVSGVLIDFITTHTGTTTTRLDLETQGVHWQIPAPIAAGISIEAGTTHGFSINSQGTLAVAWIAKDSDQQEVRYAYSLDGTDGSISWSPAVVVSAGSDVVLKHTQLVIDEDENVHIIWSSETGTTADIYYRRCQDDRCSTPVVLSGAGGSACDQAPDLGRNDWPAIAISSDGSLAAAWNAGGWLAYTSWVAGEPPPQQPRACLQPVREESQAIQWQPRLVALEQGRTAVVYSASDPQQSAPISLIYLTQDGPETTRQIGQGGLAEVYADRSGKLHLTWCGAGGAVSYQPPDGPIETISFPACRSRPGLFQDILDRPHLVWYSDQVENNFAERLPENVIYESIRMAEGWSEPALIASTDQATTVSTTSVSGGTAFVAWQASQDSSPALVYARQDPYRCSSSILSASGLAVLDAIQSGGFHPAGYQPPFCRNRFDGLVYMPNPLPEFSTQAATTNGGYDRLAEIVQGTRYELLISNMQWDQDQNKLSPGYRVTEGVADLYRQIKADPARFPRGLTVRILLGNYPNITTFQWGDQIWNVIQDLRKAGVDQMEDAAIGWKLEVANFRGTYPHSHTKFFVIDGQTLLSAGFNISWFHLPLNHVSGKGDDLTDLGILLTGPIAQEGLTVFDDQWTDANQLVCSDLRPGDESDAWRQTCEWKTGQPTHMPEVLKFYQTDENQASFALYRTDVYKEADAAYIAALSSAKDSIDAMQVNFSAELICVLNIVSPGTCTYANALPWMQAIVQSVEQNRTRVRVMVENANMNGLENRVGISILQQELDRRGLSDYVEVRFFNGRLHTKATLIDEELLFVGSQNFHYSSFSKSGLLEFVAATESLDAIQLYQEMFEYYWHLAIPADQAVWGSSGG
jgi:phosphatidylserine/phosphatidylglycerophosphate/cardiolipin synthase-like enzyme/MFS family permease